jgi:hypothetical protein
MSRSRPGKNERNGGTEKSINPAKPEKVKPDAHQALSRTR